MFTTLQQENVLKETLNKNGYINQIDICIEECSELIQALSKFKRNKEHNVEEEIADVYIMLKQMEFRFDKSKIQETINQKIIRLGIKL